MPLAKKEQMPWEWELNAEPLNQYSLPSVVWSLRILKERVRKLYFQHFSLTLVIVILHHYIQNSQGKECSASKDWSRHWHVPLYKGLCCTESRVLCVRQLILVEMHSLKSIFTWHQNRVGNSKLTLQLNTCWLCLIHKLELNQTVSYWNPFPWRASLFMHLFFFF